MSALAEALSALADVFSRFGVAWYVFGAQAVAVRGAPRATQDLDVTAWVPPEDRERVLGALAEGGLVHRFPEIADELLLAGAVLPLSHRSGLEVDLVLAGSGLEDLALRRASVEWIDGVAAPVASATDLAVGKVLAGRGKDLDDLRGLIAGGAVDLVEVRDLLAQLEEALGQSDLLPRLEQALI